MKTKNIKIVLLILIFACTSCSKTKPLKNNKSIKKEEDVYKIAVAAPQFGPYESLGLSIINGAELAVDLKNKNGGVNGKEVKLIKIDDGGLPGEGTWRAETIVQEMVLGVIGHLNSDISIPASEIYSKAKIPQITPGSTSPFFTERKEVKGFVFRTIGRDDEQGKISSDYVQKNGFKKIAVLFNNRPYGSSLASEFLKNISTNSKTEVVFYESYKIGKGNFNSEINKLIKKDPDFIFFIGEYGDAANFLNQARSVGIMSVFLGSDGVFDEDFIKVAEKNSEDSLIISAPPVMDKHFEKLYNNKFQKNIGSFSASSFDATNILINAIEKVKVKDSEKVAKEVQNTKDFSGITGKISFSDKGDLTRPGFSLYKVENSMFVVFKQ